MNSCTAVRISSIVTSGVLGVLLLVAHVEVEDFVEGGFLACGVPGVVAGHVADRADFAFAVDRDAELAIRQTLGGGRTFVDVDAGDCVVAVVVDQVEQQRLDVLGFCDLTAPLARLLLARAV